MRVPLSWLRSYVDLPDVAAADLAAALVRAGLEVETVEPVGADVRGVVVGEVRTIEELTGFKKPIRYCTVDVDSGTRGIVCGATNFAVGDRVPVALPGAVLPGSFEITARSTYGHTSDGMICSARELGVSDEHAGILVLDGDPAIGADVVELLSLRDDVLDIAITPDRGYCLSVRGVAREAATAYGVPFRDPGRVEAAPPAAARVEVRLDDPAGCDRYVARLVTGLDSAARSPLWLSRRLALAGMRSISLAVDVTNHVLLDLGQPLHAFDRGRLAGPVVVRRARPAERLRTLDGVDRALDPEDLVIADDSGAVALAGVMGGAATEVTAATTDVLIEAAHFDPVTVARTARRHRLPSEASRRFERGVDDALAPAAAEAAVRLLVALGGAKDPAEVTDVDLRVPRPSITLRPARVGALAGRAYSDHVVRRRLADVGCTVAGSDPLEVAVPSWRPDLRDPIDLVEEVARLEGYDTIPSVLPPAPGGRGLSVAQRARRTVGRALAARGFVEVLTSPWLGPAALDVLGLPADDPRLATARLANPLTEDEPLLRTTLLPGLLGALTRNVGRGTSSVALMETGLVFHRAAGAPPAPRPGVGGRPSPEELAALDAALPFQPRHFAVVMCGDRLPAGWWGAGRPAAWGDAVEAARAAAAAARVPLTVSRGELAPWHPGRCAALSVGDRVIGHAGELHPRVVAALELPARTCAMELDLDALLGAAPEVVPAPLVSPFPPAAVDVALVVDAGVPAADVEAALRSGSGAELESVRLFDVYSGPQVGEGRRSLAFTLRFRAPDRTLTAAEVARLRGRAIEAAAAQVGAELRAA